jgi:hypothetical protein
VEEGKEKKVRANACEEQEESKRERGRRMHTDSQAREGWKVEEDVGEERRGGESRALGREK